MITLKPARRIPADGILRTRSGKQVRVTSHNAFSIKGIVRYHGKRQEIHWFDTGNHIGSNVKHSLDIDWKETRRLEAQRLKRKEPRKVKYPKGQCMCNGGRGWCARCYGT